MCIVNSFRKAFKTKEERGWDTIYIAVDLHGTILNSNHSSENLPDKLFGGAAEALKLISKRKDIMKLIMFTSSTPEHIAIYSDMLKEHGIIFDYINCNPEVETKPGGYGYYKDKFYFNVLIDDKAGFDAETEWYDILHYFIEAKRIN